MYSNMGTFTTRLRLLTSSPEDPHPHVPLVLFAHPIQLEGRELKGLKSSGEIGIRGRVKDEEVILLSLLLFSWE